MSVAKVILWGVALMITPEEMKSKKLQSNMLILLVGSISFLMACSILASFWKKFKIRRKKVTRICKVEINIQGELNTIKSKRKNT